MGIEDYPTSKIDQASQFELQQMISKFESTEISKAKLGLFLGYNAVVLAGLCKFAGWYIKSKWLKKEQPRTLSKSQLSLFNVVKRGSLLGVTLGGFYVVSFALMANYCLPLSTFKKYCELQQAKNSFSSLFDPFYQEMLLFRKMRKFGLSDSLIDEVRNQLNFKRDTLIADNKLRKQTIDEIRRAVESYQRNPIL